MSTCPTCKKLGSVMGRILVSPDFGCLKMTKSFIEIQRGNGLSSPYVLYNGPLSETIGDLPAALEDLCDRVTPPKPRAWRVGDRILNHDGSVTWLITKIDPENQPFPVRVMEIDTGGVDGISEQGKRWVNLTIKDEEGGK